MSETSAPAVADDKERVGFGRPPRHAQWKKGQSGNPGGRPGGVVEIQALARSHGIQAVQTLVKWMLSNNPAASIAAAEKLLIWGFGQPKQIVQLDATIDVGLSDNRLDPAQVAAAIMAKHGMEAWAPTITSEVKEIGRDDPATPPLSGSDVTE